MTRWVWKRWVWAVLAGAAVAVGTGVLAQPGKPRSAGNDDTITLRFPGQPDRKVKVVRVTPKSDGSVETEVKDPTSGQTFTLIDKAPTGKAPAANPPAPVGRGPAPMPQAPTATPLRGAADADGQDRRILGGRLGGSNPEPTSDTNKRPGFLPRVFGKKPEPQAMPGPVPSPNQGPLPTAQGPFYNPTPQPMVMPGPMPTKPRGPLTAEPPLVNSVKPQPMPVNPPIPVVPNPGPVAVPMPMPAVNPTPLNPPVVNPPVVNSTPLNPPVANPPAPAPNIPVPMPNTIPGPMPIPNAPGGGPLPTIPPPPGGTSQAALPPVVQAGFVPAELDAEVATLRTALTPTKRMTAAECLANGRHGSTDGVKGLLFQSAQHDPCPAVRACCIEQLAKLGYQTPAFTEFLKTAGEDKSAEVKEAARDAVKKLAPRQK